MAPIWAIDTQVSPWELIEFTLLKKNPLYLQMSLKFKKGITTVRLLPLAYRLGYETWQDPLELISVQKV